MVSRHSVRRVVQVFGAFTQPFRAQVVIRNSWRRFAAVVLVQKVVIRRVGVVVAIDCRFFVGRRRLAREQPLHRANFSNRKAIGQGLARYVRGVSFFLVRVVLDQAEHFDERVVVLLGLDYDANVEIEQGEHGKKDKHHVQAHHVDQIAERDAQVALVCALGVVGHP